MAQVTIKTAPIITISLDLEEATYLIGMLQNPIMCEAMDEPADQYEIRSELFYQLKEVVSNG